MRTFDTSCFSSLIALLFVSHAVAQEITPGDACTAGQINYFQQSGGPETGGDVYFLRCDGSNWVLANVSANVSGNGSVPSGAVMAFDLTSCPSGWAPLATAVGRVVIGAGTYAANADADGSNYENTVVVTETGGNVDYTLSISEMPSHSHTATVGADSAGGTSPTPVDNLAAVSGRDRDFSGAAPDELMRDGNVLVEDTGGGNAFGLMPPYLALLYCKKN